MSFLFLLACLLIPTAVCQEQLVWIGAVTESSFTVHADIAKDVTNVVLSPSSDFSTILSSHNPDSAAAVVGDVNIYRRLRRFKFEDLTPATEYHVGIDRVLNSTIQSIAVVHTFPAEGSSTDVTFVLSSCQYFASWDGAFKDIHQRYIEHIEKTPLTPFVMLHMGDLVYSNIAENDVSLYEKSIRDVVTGQTIQKLFRRIPVVYMYDDHDYGSNNADRNSPSRPAAMTNFRAMVPSYTPAVSDELYNAFTIGQVRVIVTDLRSHASKKSNSTIGETQRKWFLSELANASSYAVVVWLSTKPWIGDADPSQDGWNGYASEREFLANEMVRLKVTNLVFVAGDAHMLAADDGSNSDYSSASSDGHSGFPVFQAAPFANVGTSKGGLYSEGCHAFRFYPNEQYGVLRISNVDGLDNTPCVEFSGFKKGRMTTPVVKLRKCGQLSAVRGKGGQDSSCSLALFPTFVWILLSVAILWITATCVTLSLLYRSLRNERTFKEQRDYQSIG